MGRKSEGVMAVERSRKLAVALEQRAGRGNATYALTDFHRLLVPLVLNSAKTSGCQRQDELFHHGAVIGADITHAAVGLEKFGHGFADFSFRERGRGLGNLFGS